LRGGEKLQLPSPRIFRKLILIIENREYMSMMKEKLAEIKDVYRNLKLAPVRV